LQLTLDLLGLFRNVSVPARGRVKTVETPLGEFVGRPSFVKRCERLVDDVLFDRRWMSFQDWASVAWYHVVGSGNDEHARAGVRVEAMRTWGGASWYFSKYIGKELDEDLSEFNFGRSWGVFNRAVMPWAKIVDLDLSDDVGVRVRRIARRYLEHLTGHKRCYPFGLTLYCDVTNWSRLWAERVADPF
jgi:hypothetical protein